MKYRIKVVDCGYKKYFPQMRIFGFWCRVPEYSDGSGSDCFVNEYGLEICEHIIARHKAACALKPTVTYINN